MMMEWRGADLRSEQGGMSDVEASLKKWPLTQRRRLVHEHTSTRGAGTSIVHRGEQRRHGHGCQICTPLEHGQG